jgi:hypothetical protein
MALELIKSAMSRLKELNDDMNKASKRDDFIKDGRGRKRTANDIKKRLRQYITQSDPA